MIVGSVGYATESGLGRLLKDFYDNGVVNEVFQVTHRSFENHNWYGQNFSDLKGFIKQCDVLLLFETPFWSNTLDLCEKHNTKKVLMPMYECTPREYTEDRFDLILNPSALDQQWYPSGVEVTVPIPNWVKHRVRTKAETFAHNGGHLGIHGRNGTKELLTASEDVNSAKIIVRSQNQIEPTIQQKYRNIKFQIGTFQNHQLYNDDVFVFPEKFNGLSLPLQEAKASGMVICATDRFPINTWNNKKFLIQPYLSKKLTIEFNGKTIDTEECHPLQIANKINQIHKMSSEEIRQESLAGLEFKNQNSWEIWKPKYIDLLGGIQ